MTCKLKQAADGVWFPSTVELEETRNDKPHSKQVLKVQVLSLNQRMDEKLFTLAGLPSDVLVIREPPISQDPRRAQPGAAPQPAFKRPPLMLWDGKVVRPFTDEDGMAIQASHRQPQPTAGAKPAAERPTSRQANE